jgi:hypothetical protein
MARSGPEKPALKHTLHTLTCKFGWTSLYSMISRIDDWILVSMVSMRT